MRKYIFLILTLYSFALSAQDKEIKKPTYVIIVNDEIITQEKLKEYAQQGLIKAMHKGVTQEERDKLAEKFGSKIGDKEFIMKVEVDVNNGNSQRQSQVATSKKDSIAKSNSLLELKLKANDIAKDFTVQMIDGKKIKLSDLRGKVILLNYWATWCAPCLMEFSEMPEKILEPFKGKDFVFIPISIGESKEKVLKKMSAMKKYGVDFNVGIDPEKEIWDLYATGSLPKNFIIDKNGIIKYVSIGNSEGNLDSIKKAIDKLLKE